MFMASAILARSGAMPERARDLNRAAQLLMAYAGRLQQPDGIFHHATDGPAAWGRGNGFAAFGLMETLTAMPAGHPSRAAVLGIFQKQMKGLVSWQAPDGMWREIINRPGAYREETATAMILTAMARGVRLGWLDRTYAPISIDRTGARSPAHYRRRRWSMSAAEPAPARPCATTSIALPSRAQTIAAAPWPSWRLWKDYVKKKPRRAQRTQRKKCSCSAVVSAFSAVFAISSDRVLYAMMSWITLPETSVNLKSRPL